MSNTAEILRHGNALVPFNEKEAQISNGRFFFTANYWHGIDVDLFKFISNWCHFNNSNLT